MKNKKIWIGVIAAIIVALLIAHFGFHKEIWNKINSDVNNKNVVKNENIELKGEKKCFVKEVDNKKRIIILANNEDGIRLVGGDTTLVDGKVIDIFVFNGLKKDNLIDAVGDIKKVSTERFYKLSNGGVIEGKNKEDNLDSLVENGKKIVRIKKLENISFEDKFLIKEVDCDTLIK